MTEEQQEIEEAQVIQETQIVKVDEEISMELDSVQMAEQLYTTAGLDPVVSAGLKDYDDNIKRENKFINKVLGPREDDIQGYGKAVAKRVAYAVYTQLNRQYGGKVGNLRDYILNLEDERNRANMRYDELMGRVIGILGEEYKQLRSDSNEFMEKLNATIGEDLKANKFDQKALAESLGNIDGMRNQVLALEKEKQLLVEKHAGEVKGLGEKHESQVKELTEKNAAQVRELTEKNAAQVKDLTEKHAAEMKEQKDRYESQAATARTEYREEIKELKDEAKATLQAHNSEVKSLEARITALENDIKKLTGERDGLTADLKALTGTHGALTAAVAALAETVPHQEIGNTTGEEIYSFILKDSKVPDAVIEGVGKFLDFRKYLKMAAAQAAEKATAGARDELQKNGKQA